MKCVWLIYFFLNSANVEVRISWSNLESPLDFEITRVDCMLHRSWLQGGWSVVAKMSCILHHSGVQLILAYSWARPTILVAGKDRGGMLLFLLFLHFHSFSSSLSLAFISSTISFFSLSLGDDTKWPTRVDVSLDPIQKDPGWDALADFGLDWSLISQGWFQLGKVCMSENAARASVLLT